MTQTMHETVRSISTRRPRIGFLGVGWIGRHRMKTMLDTGLVEAAAIADTSPAMLADAASLAPEAKQVNSFDDLLDAGVDGVVIATPTALHANQSIRALKNGASVFCQKPLGRTRAEVQSVLDAALAADRLLAVDLSYRFTRGMRLIREAVHDGRLGQVYAVDLTFHNAYGPVKSWFYDPALSGGGCVMDLGVHLVDLALWALDFPKVQNVSASLFFGGKSLRAGANEVEDYAIATLMLETGGTVRLACSWRLHAGRDAVISAVFYGTEGGAGLHNVNGSFYDFVAELHRGTSRTILSEPPDAWFGRAGIDWATRLAAGERFEPAVKQLAEVAEVLDQIYAPFNKIDASI